MDFVLFSPFHIFHPFLIKNREDDGDGRHDDTTMALVVVIQLGYGNIFGFRHDDATTTRHARHGTTTARGSRATGGTTAARGSRATGGTTTATGGMMTATGGMMTATGDTMTDDDVMMYAVVVLSES